MPIPLSMLSEGMEGRIVAITGGRGLMRRLADLGFNPDTRAQVFPYRKCGGGFAGHYVCSSDAC